jgi:hypothetical protein
MANDQLHKLGIALITRMKISMKDAIERLGCQRVIGRCLGYFEFLKGEMILRNSRSSADPFVPICCTCSWNPAEAEVTPTNHIESSLCVVVFQSKAG